MIAAIEEGGYVRGMSDRLRELEDRQDRIAERLAGALADPRDRDEAADAIRELIERIALTPGQKRGEMHAALHGNLGTILEWAGKRAADTPGSGMSVSVVARAAFAEAVK